MISSTAESALMGTVPSSIRLNDARVVLVDEQLYTRHLMQHSLNAIGFREIEGCSEVSDMLEALEFVRPDLVIVDIDNQRELVCRAIQGIRNGHFGLNPFILIAATTWMPEQDTIDAALNAGIDDIIAKPISAQTLRARVANLVDNRREFVATSTYLGPDRRTGDRPPSPNDLPTVRVPNALRAKAKRKDAEVFDDAAIAQAVRALAIQKTFRLASDISRVARDLERQLKRAPSAALAKGTAKQLSAQLDEIDRIIGEQGLRSIVSAALETRSILDQIAGAGGAAAARQYATLHARGKAVAQTLRESEESAGWLAPLHDPEEEAPPEVKKCA